MDVAKYYLRSTEMITIQYHSVDLCIYMCVCVCALTIGFARMGARSWVTLPLPPKHISPPLFVSSLIMFDKFKSFSESMSQKFLL